MAVARVRYRDLLRRHDFRVMVGAFVVDQIGSWAYNVVLVVWVFDKTRSPTWIAATTAAAWVPRLLFSAYAGVLADRYERTQVMLVSALTSFVAMAGLALLVAGDGPPAAALALAAVAAVCTTGYRPAAGALLPEIVPERELVAANSVFGALDGLVVVLGPGIGGLMLVAGSAAVGIALNALSFLASALFVVRLTVRSRGSAGTSGEKLLAQIGAGAGALRRQPVVLVLVAFCCLDSGVYAASTVVYVPLSERLGTGASGYSYLIAGFSVGGVLFAAFANRASAAPRLAPVILGGMLMLALPFAMVSAVHSAAAAFALQILSGGGMVIVDVLAITALQRDLPRDVLSRVLGIFETAIPTVLLLSSFLTATVLRHATLNQTLLAIGLGFSAAALLGLPPLMRADRRSVATVRALAPRVRLLDGLDLLAGASRLALERLAQAAVQVELPAGRTVVREGDDADALWVLVAGSVVVAARGEGGRAIQLRSMPAGSYFGEIGLLHGLPRTATVRTAEASTLLRIDGTAFLEAVRGAGVSNSLLARSSARLARSHPRLSAAAPVAVPLAPG